ncbi:helix-turn-helix domain-containing protein [Pantoea endophytica]|uniref:winged helix-turn-helix transcriptional regulator n=1 Tax=Pantoea endophytica TaxID=92488 RepID=UPI0030161006
MKNQPLYNMPCPIARSLGRIGDGWSILIMRDALAGFTRFDEFQKSSGIASNILSRRLKELVDYGLLEKVCYSTSPARFEYHLTAVGRDFRGVILALTEWGSTHFSPEGRQMQLVESATQRPVKMQLVDSENGQPLTMDNYQMVPGPAAEPMMHYRHDYLQKKRAGDNTQKFAPPPLHQPQS